MKDIKETLISKIISSYIKTHRTKNGIYQAECPFCDSRKRTLLIDDSRGIYFCSNDGSNGDAILFIQRFCNVNFEKAISVIDKM